MTIAIAIVSIIIGFLIGYRVGYSRCLKQFTFALEVLLKQIKKNKESLENMIPLPTTEDAGIINITIKELVRRWGIHPFDINNGHCEEFAEIIATEIDEARMEWGEESASLFGPEHTIPTATATLFSM